MDYVSSSEDGKLIALFYVSSSEDGILIALVYVSSSEDGKLIALFLFRPRKTVNSPSWLGFDLVMFCSRNTAHSGFGVCSLIGDYNS